MRDPRYDCLFEPLQIGPVLTKNRFYQVPHCSGMGRGRPRTLAAMRGMKAEGGWGVVCTEYCSIHPTSDDAAYPFATLWDDSDIKANALMTDAVHEHGALAGVELWIGGNYISNYDSRTPPLGLQSRPATHGVHPVQSKRISKKDIRNIRRWHADAARRAVSAGFDIVYVYATHGYLLSEFLDPHNNNRSDEYGGSLTNRCRIIKELIEETKNAVGDTCAVATRFSVDLSDPESYDAFASMAELPDLWDLTIHDYNTEMAPSRFAGEGALLEHIEKARQLTSKPIVSVGRFTSPDTMASVVRSGTQDLIGAARPSIADPFLPTKIKEGRIEDIRECIGCNVCYAHNSLNIPIRCTQNPTMGEEWRKQWHPEKFNSASTHTGNDKVLVIGAGPAGLEAARVLGRRGFGVMLADSRKKPGGRVTREATLPGMSEWARVAHWRLGQIEQMPHVEIYPDSHLEVDDVFETGAAHVLVATGAQWATDGIGRHANCAFSGSGQSNVISPDAIIDGSHNAPGHYLIYDDDHYYLGPVLALQLAKLGSQVTVMTPMGRLCDWGNYTDEISANNRAVLESGAKLVVNQQLGEVESNSVKSYCVFSGSESTCQADWIVPLSRQIPDDGLYQALKTDSRFGQLKTLDRIGDCLAPGLIAAAVYSGYEAGINLGTDAQSQHVSDEVNFAREIM